MIKNESVNTDYSKSIKLQKERVALFYLIKDRLGKSWTRFAFVDYDQWLLLGLVNLVCLGFITFVCSWIAL